MKKASFYLIAALSAGLVFLFSSCGNTYNAIKRMQKLEEGVDNPVTKEELQEAIEKYDKRAMDLVLAQEQEGMWFKILGTRYIDLKMFGKALECYQRAIEFFPTNANLHYYVGYCAEALANVTNEDFNLNGLADETYSRERYLSLSENGYLTALDLDPSYTKAMYGLGVLYVFERQKYAEAIPYLEKFLQTEKKDTNAMFVLAHAYYCEYDFQKALNLYDQIISLKPNQEKVNQATENKAQVLKVMNQ